ARHLGRALVAAGGRCFRGPGKCRRVATFRARLHPLHPRSEAVPNWGQTTISAARAKWWSDPNLVAALRSCGRGAAGAGQEAAAFALALRSAAPRHAALARIPVVTSIAAMWTATAASAMSIEPEAVISRAGLFARHKGTSAGTSIRPAPWAVAMTKDQTAMP